MKFNRILTAALLVGALCSSCSKDPKDDPELDWIVYFNDITAFNSNGSWEFCYDEDMQDVLTFYNNGEAINFSHSCQRTEWDGIAYYSWRGFTPSRADDTTDYSSDGNWTDHQWTAMPGTGMFKQPNYMIGFCNAEETAADALTSTTTVIKPFTTKEFKPKYVYLTNTTWGYYAMKNGSAFNKKFTSGDWCKLTITGVSGDVSTGKVEFYLAKDGEFVQKWTMCDLSPIAKCERLVFTMESSDSGQWGMNNPSYFALGEFIWGY